MAESKLYGRKSKCGVMAVSEAQRLRGLEGENRRLKQTGSRSPPGPRSALTRIVRKNGWPA